MPITRQSPSVEVIAGSANVSSTRDRDDVLPSVTSKAGPPSAPPLIRQDLNSGALPRGPAAALPGEATSQTKGAIRNEAHCYYTMARAHDENIFDVWERGGSVGDSITPATRSPEYRQWMTRLIRQLLPPDTQQPLLSIGCGNAFIESELSAEGHRLIAFDICKEAVALARRKGVDARVQDIIQWEPYTADFALAFCDGIFGHLYDEAAGFQPLLRKLQRALLDGGVVLISNDASLLEVPVQKHPSVPGFYWFSPAYLESQLVESGFVDVQSRSYVYERPCTGARKRLIVSARLPERDLHSELR